MSTRTVAAIAEQAGYASPASFSTAFKQEYGQSPQGSRAQAGTDVLPPQKDTAEMLLEGKAAVIYGGSGAVGAAVGRVFSREDERVHLVGQTEATPRNTAGAIRPGAGTRNMPWWTRLTRPLCAPMLTPWRPATGGSTSR